jgi:hypothetical protein
MGLGRPASSNNNRSHVSFGDIALPSANANDSLKRRRPRAPLCCAASTFTSPMENGAARINASNRDTAACRGKWRPKSKAVRGTVVTGRPRTNVTSRELRLSSRTTKPHCGRAFSAISSIGIPASTHSAPCSAVATAPATTARRRDYSQAPTMRSFSDGSLRRGTYTSRKIG